MHLEETLVSLTTVFLQWSSMPYVYHVMVNSVEQASAVTDCHHPADEDIFWNLEAFLGPVTDTEAGSSEDVDSAQTHERLGIHTSGSIRFVDLSQAISGPLNSPPGPTLPTSPVGQVRARLRECMEQQDVAPAGTPDTRLPVT